MPAAPTQEEKRFRTLVWIIALATVGLMFDGYDLVVYGTVVSTFLRDPTQIGAVDPALAGQLGSYALLGVLFGALLAGSIGDFLGRRKMMLGAYAWFSLGMAATAFTHTATTFGLFRFMTGLGSLAAAALAILLLGHVSWRGMFLIGSLPFVTLLPLAWLKMPESVVWLVSRGRIEEARAVAAKTGVELPVLTPATVAEEQGAVGYRGLFGDFLAPAVIIGLMSATGLLLVYSLNTWLPELMLRAGFNAKGSLSFLLVLNGAAALGPILAARFADRFGPKPVVAASFLLGAAAIAALTLSLPLAALLAIVALVGVGTSGTQTLIYGFVANYFPTRVRGAGVAWCAGFGRLGGVGGPLIGGLLIAAGLSIQTIFFILAGLALTGVALTLLVPSPKVASGLQVAPVN